MKKIALLIGIIIAVGLGSMAYYMRPSKPKVEIAPVEQAFANASEADKAAAQKVIDLVKAGEYGKALVLLEELPYELEDLASGNDAVLLQLADQIQQVLGDKAEAELEAARKAMEGAANDADQSADEATAAATDAASAAAGAADAAAKAAGQAVQDAAGALQK